ncbi:PREDICTED: endocuticle structural glycoprotein SgAbd-2-like, partial [Nicrophorus vespilloides]|uniref:Endocuticle structural glycoprotein SgAbd-2-like n=1 Tax=Nicrophorus vespilloides TaxID=110193 RepID=A0ABM1NFY3_NICVS
EIQDTEHKKQIPILKQDFEQHHEGYQFSYETGNGISRQEQGYIKNKGDKKHETLVQQGSITYHDEHGHPITLTYIADEHGFQPQGSHLPTPPPIPAEIAKALEEKAHQSYQQPSQDDYQHQYEHY